MIAAVYKTCRAQYLGERSFASYIPSQAEQHQRKRKTCG